MTDLKNKQVSKSFLTVSTCGPHSFKQKLLRQKYKYCQEYMFLKVIKYIIDLIVVRTISWLLHRGVFLQIAHLEQSDDLMSLKKKKARLLYFVTISFLKVALPEGWKSEYQLCQECMLTNCFLPSSLFCCLDCTWTQTTGSMLSPPSCLASITVTHTWGPRWGWWWLWSSWWGLLWWWSW